jgi:hypothetical protein
MENTETWKAERRQKHLLLLIGKRSLGKPQSGAFRPSFVLAQSATKKQYKLLAHITFSHITLSQQLLLLTSNNAVQLTARYTSGQLDLIEEQRARCFNDRTNYM